MNDPNVPATQTFSGTYVVDRDHSSLQFAVEHMKLSSFRASFEDVHGRLAAGADGISIEGSAPVRSISIKAPPELRDQIIRDFFLGDDHPEVIFRSTEVELGRRALAIAGRATGPAGAASLGLRERQRLERDLHDGAQQRLVSLALTLRMAREKLDTEPGETGRLLDRSREELAQALRELRDLARGLHPAVLADRGLGAAAEALAERAPLPVKVVSELPSRRLPEHVELTAYFVVSETLTNVAKHAAATKASVTLTQRDGRLAIEVRDDGVGGADLDRGTGLRGLADRVAAIDGRLEIDSKPQGTIVRASLPCPEAAPGRGLSAPVPAPHE